MKVRKYCLADDAWVRKQTAQVVAWRKMFERASTDAQVRFAEEFLKLAGACRVRFSAYVGTPEVDRRLAADLRRAEREARKMKAEFEKRRARFEATRRLYQAATPTRKGN